MFLEVAFRMLVSIDIGHWHVPMVNIGHWNVPVANCSIDGWDIDHWHGIYICYDDREENLLAAGVAERKKVEVG